jgi:superfamily II DNA or RNA helicase
VILASTQQRRQMVQRMGRVMRRKRDGRAARFVIVYVNGTSEDPERGAQEAFFDEMLAVAELVKTFPPGSSAEEIRRFLAPRSG